MPTDSDDYLIDGLIKPKANLDQLDILGDYENLEIDELMEVEFHSFPVDYSE